MEGFVLLDTGAWSLVPPLLALALALITKEVYSSLLIGIVSGLLIYQFSLAGVGLEQTIDGLCLLPNIFIEQISANAGLILFLALLGALTMLITKAGGSIAYAKWAREAHQESARCLYCHRASGCDHLRRRLLQLPNGRLA